MSAGAAKEAHSASVDAVKTPAPKGSKRRRSDTLWGYFFIAPQLFGLLVFVLIPMLSVFFLSVMEWDGLGEMSFVGLSNFTEQFASSEFRVALLNTAYYTVIAVPSGIGLGLIVATILNKVRGKTFYRLFFFMPYITSTVAVAVIWIWVLNADFGLVNAYLQEWFGIQGPKWLSNRTLVIPSIAMVAVWQGLGFNMVIFLAGLQSIPTTYSEAARIDGANRMQVFRHITLPLLSPTIFFVLIISIIGSFQVFDLAFVMTQGGPGKASYTLVYHLYSLAFEDFTFGASSAAAVILFAIILSLTLFQFRFQRRWVHYDD
jgi:multiple sugar transport system permease protein